MATWLKILPPPPRYHAFFSSHRFGSDLVLCTKCLCIRKFPPTKLGMGDAYFFSFGGCAAYKCTKTFLYGEENGARQVFFPVRKHTPLAGKVQVLSEDEVPPVKAVPAPVPEQQNENNGRQAPTLLKGSFGLLAIGRVFPWPPMGAMAGFALRSHENNEPAAPLSPSSSNGCR